MTDGKDKSTVALFVDFDHLCRFTDGALRPLCPLSSALESVVCRVRELGVVVSAGVYADWEKHPGMPGEIKRLNLDPRFVFSTGGSTPVSVARTHGTVISLALDAMQSIYERPDIDTYVVVASDLGLIDLIGRLRSRRKRVLLIAFERAVQDELRQSAPEFEPIESYIQPGIIDSEDTPPSPEDYEPVPRGEFDWQPFIMLLNRLETNLPFVSLKYLKNQLLTPAHGCENSIESKTNLIREAIRLHYIETRKVPNPRNPKYDTTACRLNRKHPEVRRILGD